MKLLFFILFLQVLFGIFVFSLETQIVLKILHIPMVFFIGSVGWGVPFVSNWPTFPRDSYLSIIGVINLSKAHIMKSSIPHLF